MDNNAWWAKAAIVVIFLVTISPYFVFFTAPAYLIAVVLLWFTRQKVLTKILWSVVPVLLWIPYCFAALYLVAYIDRLKGQKLHFEFAEGFEGKVIVIPNMPCGQPVKRAGGTEYLFIPESGVLLYQGDIKTGGVYHTYSIREANDNVHPLPDNELSEDGVQQDSTRKGVWLWGTGSKSGQEGTKRYQFLELMVASYKSRDKYNDHVYTDRLQELADSLVDACN